MKGIKREDTSNEDINLQADALTDLPVADEQADETKGGENEGLGYNTWRANFGRTS